MTTNPNQHERIRADLKAYADGELSPLARFFVARHLRACPSCREELIQMQTLSTELRESDSEIAETPLSTELRAHILENAPTTDAEPLPEEEVVRPRRISPKKAIFAVGVAAILLVVGINSLSLGRAGGGMADMAPAPVVGTIEAKRSATGSIPADPSANLPMAGGGAGAASASAGSAATSSTTQNTNGMFSDGHVKMRTESQSAIVNNVEESRRGVTDQVAPSNNAFLRQPGTSTTIANPTSVVPPTRAVHREGSLSVAVQNAESAGDDAASIIKNAGGFVANTSLDTGAGQRRTAVLDCRVPVAQFETVVKKIGALGTVRSKSLSGQDITAQVAQSGARRQTLAQDLAIAQARLNKLENSRKPNAYDLYQMRAEVRSIRMQAAQARAALETLQKYGSLSSLYVSLQDGVTSPTPHAAGWFDSLSPSSQAAWTAFLNNARLPLQLLLWVLAYSPLWLPALIIWHKYGRKWLTS